MKEKLARIVEDGQKLFEGEIRLKDEFKKVIGKISIELDKIPVAKEGVLCRIRQWKEFWRKSCLDCPSLVVIRKFDGSLPEIFQGFYESLREENIENQEAIKIVEGLLKKLES